MRKSGHNAVRFVDVVLYTLCLGTVHLQVYTDACSSIFGSHNSPFLLCLQSCLTSTPSLVIWRHEHVTSASSAFNALTSLGVFGLRAPGMVHLR